MAFLFPAEINILGTTYHVQVTRDGLDEDDCGETVVATRTIKISPDLCTGVQIETFYHELVHAMLGHLGLDNLLDEKSEDAIAQGLGMTLAYVIATNQLPKLNGRSGE